MFKDSTISIGFTNDKVPQFVEPKSNQQIPYVKYGEGNNYPEFLLTLFNRSAKHNAIITSKQSYIKGQGWTFDQMGMEGEQIALLKSFVDAPNEYESLTDLMSKTCLDNEIFGGFYLKGVNNKKGELVDYKYELRPVGSIFIIDEAQNYFSSRDFKETYSKTLIPYMTRHRHYYHSIWWASQKVDQVDITFRRNTEQIYFLENLASKALLGGLEKCQISVYESYLGIESGVPPLAKSVYAYDKRFYK